MKNFLSTQFGDKNFIPQENSIFADFQVQIIKKISEGYPSYSFKSSALDDDIEEFYHPKQLSTRCAV